MLKESHEITQGMLEQYELALKTKGEDLTPSQKKRAMIEAAIEAGWFTDTKELPFNLQDLSHEELLNVYYPLATMIMRFKNVEVDFLLKSPLLRRAAEVPQSLSN